MAIASLHTISVLGDSPRQVPRQVVDEGNNRTQASSVFQMWRKIEDVHTGSGVEQRAKALRQRSDEFNDDISTQTSESNYSEQRAYFEEIDESIGCSSLPEGQSGMKVGGRDIHEKSPAIGDSERKRVRKIFQDWMNCGGSGHSSNSHQMSGSSRAQLLGDNECERVRVVREWVQLTAQDRGSYSDRKAVTEIGAQIEMVRDGLVLNQNEGRPNRVRRKIRRLCGKQALLDLLVKAEKERESELLDLTKHHAVSQFPHRNRIQSLLKSRFLRIRNNISSEKQKTRSTAAGELGLLRQRHTVSDLREGFLSRTDSSGQSQLGGSFNTLSSSNANATGTNESKTGTKEDITEKIHEQNDSANEQSVFRVVSEQTRHASSGSPTLVNEQALQDDEVNVQQSAGGELTISSPGTVAEEIVQENTSNKRSPHHGGHDGEMSSQIEVVIDLSCDPSGSINQGRDFHGSSACMNDSGVSMVEDLNLQGHVTEDEAMHGQHSDNEDGRMDRVAYIDWRNTINNDMGNNGIMGNVEGLSMDALENEMDESVLSEGHDMWDASESQDSVEEWLQGSSRQTSGAFASLDTFNGSEDDIRTSELNELVGRRRVSNLLESGFRENLNRVLQTYVERQAQASVGWDLNDSTSSPVSEVLHQEQQTENHNGHSVDTFGPYNRSRGPPPHTRREHVWDQIAWTHNMHQPLGFQDWEVINELRLDITTLQLRVNDMQRMLEACMDMQLELQRSIRQEVSAALNRSASPESADAGLADDKSRWELVRKGICCVCSHGNIDSLLYRCGHMCTCTKCANRLFEEKSKCPMCRSPIVQVIRAYSIQQQQ